MSRVPWFKETLAVMEKTARLGADAGVRTGILSDCCEWDASVIMEHAGKYAPYCFFSFAMGHMKPDRRVQFCH